ncbi:unnamed protein product [Agarophyton chilense]
MTPQRSASTLHLRHSIAPRVLDNSLPMSSVVSNARFSVRVAPPHAAPAASSSPSTLLTTFVWRDLGAEVKLAGSFDSWRKHPMTYVPSIAYHVLVVELPPGSYHYRFVVDGRWRTEQSDPNLTEDEFGELSHFIHIDASVAERAPLKRFSTACVTPAHPSISEHAVVKAGESDSESECESGSDAASEPQSDDEHQSRVSHQPLPPRNRDSAFIKDYDDDPCGELDLQADVFEAMKDVAETTPEPPHQDNQPTVAESRARHRFRRPGKRTLRKVWALLFGDTRDDHMDEDEQPSPITRNQKLHGMADRSSKGLKVWFPNEKKAPHPVNGRKVQPSETKDVIDVGEKALRLHQVEENANARQMLGKTLFAQGKYDAALALFSLSVKLREDNGLKFAKTTAIAHTDVASAFIHIDDLKNAEKHLNNALSIFEKGTFSGGRAQLGDVYCFLGEEMSPPAGSYEELCRTWVKDARSLMGKGSYKEAIDMYTLAIYTRKRHGPWKTRENAEALVENARALFATKELEESVKALKDAIGILEELDQGKHGIFLGEVWGNLGSVLDRVPDRKDEALTAHCAGMVSYGKSGMSTEDGKWLKAWKSLCVNLKMSGATDRTNEIWQAIDLQIRGVTPMTKIDHVVLHF